MPFIYIAQTPSGFVKVGFTTKAAIEWRISDLKRFRGERAKLVAFRSFNGTVESLRRASARAAEKVLHEALSPYRIESEWYRPCQVLRELARKWGGDIAMPESE